MIVQILLHTHKNNYYCTKAYLAVVYNVIPGAEKLCVVQSFLHKVQILIIHLLLYRPISLREKNVFLQSQLHIIQM